MRQETVIRTCGRVEYLVWQKPLCSRRAGDVVVNVGTTVGTYKQKCLLQHPGVCVGQAHQRGGGGGEQQPRHQGGGGGGHRHLLLPLQPPPLTQATLCSPCSRYSLKLPFVVHVQGTHSSYPSNFMYNVLIQATPHNLCVMYSFKLPLFRIYSMYSLKIA